MIYIMRHGTTPYNKEGRLQGQRDIPLSEEGIMQAEEAALRLKDIHFDEIYSSDLIRAHKTAEIVARFHDTGGVINDRRLREIGLGTWEGKTYDYLRKNEPDYELFYNSPQLYDGDVPEKYSEVLKRLNEFFNELDHDKDILVVSHGFVIYHLLKDIHNYEPIVPIDNCEVIKYDFKNNTFERNFMR